MKQSKLSVVVAVAVLLLATMACGFNTISTGATTSGTESFDVAANESASVDIELEFGDLEVQSGASGQIEFDYEVNVAEWQPVTNQSSNSITLIQPSIENGIPIGEDVVNNWTVGLPDDVPVDLDVAVGASASTLDLSDIELIDLDVDAGAGDVDVVFADTDATFDAGVGQLTLDLSGTWSESARVSVDGGIGDITITVPDDVAVIVELNIGIGDVTVNGLTQDGDRYVNGLVGESDIVLTLDVNSGVGAITVVSE